MNFNRTYLAALVALIAPALFLIAQDVPKKEAKRVENFRRSNTAPVPALAPQRVILGWAGDPAHTQTVTWRTETRTEAPQV